MRPRDTLPRSRQPVTSSQQICWADTLHSIDHFFMKFWPAGKGKLRITDDDITLLVRDHDCPRPAKPVHQYHPHRQPHPHLRADDHAALGPRHLSCCGFTSPWHIAYTITYAGALVRVDRHGHLHPLLAPQVPHVPSAQNVATNCPMTCHLPGFAKGPRILVSYTTTSDLFL